MQMFAQQHGMPLMETSAKDDTNVEQAFVNLAETIVRCVLQQVALIGQF